MNLYDAYARASAEYRRCLNARDAGFYDESSPRLVRARQRQRTTWAALQRMRADADVRVITGHDATTNDRATLAAILADETGAVATTGGAS